MSFGFLWLTGLAVLIAASRPAGSPAESRGDERQQLKWIAYAVVVTAPA